VFALFGHQYSHVWIDPAAFAITNAREEASITSRTRAARLWQRNYAIENPHGWRSYSENVWGLTACDGPFDGEWNGRKFHTYAARGAAPNEVRDDGTIAPTAAISCDRITPNESLVAAHAMVEQYGENLYQKYGFLDSFNPTLNVEPSLIKEQTGKIVPASAWFDSDYRHRPGSHRRNDRELQVELVEDHAANEHVQRGLSARGSLEGGSAMKAEGRRQKAEARKDRAVCLVLLSAFCLLLFCLLLVFRSAVRPDRIEFWGLGREAIIPRLVPSSSARPAFTSTSSRSPGPPRTRRSSRARR
jgi:hypothetical protein